MYACVNICKVRKRKKRKWLESRQKTKLKFLPSFAQEMENIIPTQFVITIGQNFTMTLLVEMFAISAN